MKPLVFAVLLLTAGGPAVAARDAPSLRVLFVGNSATYFNNLPHVVTSLAAHWKDGLALVDVPPLEAAWLQQIAWDEAARPPR